MILLVVVEPEQQAPDHCCPSGPRPERMPQGMSEYVPQTMSEWMPDRMLRESQEICQTECQKECQNMSEYYGRKNVRFHVEGAVKSVRRNMPDTFRMIYQNYLRIVLPGGDLLKKAIVASCVWGACHFDTWPYICCADCVGISVFVCLDLQLFAESTLWIRTMISEQLLGAAAVRISELGKGTELRYQRAQPLNLRNFRGNKEKINNKNKKR